MRPRRSDCSASTRWRRDSTRSSPPSGPPTASRCSSTASTTSRCAGTRSAATPQGLLARLLRRIDALKAESVTPAELRDWAEQTEREASDAGGARARDPRARVRRLLRQPRPRPARLRQPRRRRPRDRARPPAARARRRPRRARPRAFGSCWWTSSRMRGRPPRLIEGAGCRARQRGRGVRHRPGDPPGRDRRPGPAPSFLRAPSGGRARRPRPPPPLRARSRSRGRRRLARGASALATKSR